MARPSNPHASAPTIADRAPGSTAMLNEDAPIRGGSWIRSGTYVAVTGALSGGFVLVRPWDPEVCRWVGPVAIPGATRVMTAADDLPRFGGGR